MHSEMANFKDPNIRGKHFSSKIKIKHAFKNTCLLSVIQYKQHATRFPLKQHICDYGPQTVYCIQARPNVRQLYAKICFQKGEKAVFFYFIFLSKVHKFPKIEIKMSHDVLQLPTKLHH